MTMYRTALTVLLLLALPRAIEAETWGANAFGKAYSIIVTGEDLKKTPIWDQSAENPPLSARKALKLATDSRKALIPGRADREWKLEYLGLRETEGRWYWLAHFEALPRHADFTGTPPALYVAVLMDGCYWSYSTRKTVSATCRTDQSRSALR
jgi:hypothetical protein